LVWLLINRFLFIGIGVALGVSLMCLLFAGKQANEEMQNMKRRNKE